MQKKAVRNSVLANLQERSAIAEKHLNDAVGRVIDIMEITRYQQGLSYHLFGPLIGVSGNVYYNMAKYRTTASPLAIMQFCMVFGYDLESLLFSPVSNIANDEALVEVAARMGALNDKTLNHIESLVSSDTYTNTLTRKNFCKALHEFRMSNAKLRAEYSNTNKIDKPNADSSSAEN